jgi:galactokinase
VQLLPGEDLATRVREAFGSTFGHAADTVARAPGRVNLIGEHTDYLGGLCLPVALDHATWVAVRRRPDDVVHVVSAQAGEWVGTLDQRPTGWVAYVLGALRATGLSGGLELLLDSTVPVGAGLSSSAALICAVAVATSSAPPAELVGACIRAESDEVGAPTGGMDQSVALLATPGHALLLDFASGSRQPVPWHPESAHRELLVVDTRTRHDHAAGGYADRRRESEAALQVPPRARTPLQERRARHVESENARVRSFVEALSRDDWSAVGELLTASHVSLRDDFEVSCAELDVVVGSALAHGAIGARMTGGGFGGCVIVLSPVEARDTLLSAVSTAYADRGWPEPRALVATASGPATRV